MSAFDEAAMQRSPRATEERVRIDGHHRSLVRTAADETIYTFRAGAERAVLTVLVVTFGILSVLAAWTLPMLPIVVALCVVLLLAFCLIMLVPALIGALREPAAPRYTLALAGETLSIVRADVWSTRRFEVPIRSIDAVMFGADGDMRIRTVEGALLDAPSTPNSMPSGIIEAIVFSYGIRRAAPTAEAAERWDIASKKELGMTWTEVVQRLSDPAR